MEIELAFSDLIGSNLFIKEQLMLEVIAYFFDFKWSVDC